MRLGGLSGVCPQPFVFRLSGDRRMRLTWAWLGTPNAVQMYLTFSGYCVTGDLSRRGIIGLFFLLLDLADISYYQSDSF